MMKREEILLKAQEQGLSKEYESKVLSKAMIYANIVTALMCVVIIAVKMIAYKQFDFGVISVFLAFSGIVDTYEGVKNNIKKKKVFGIFELVISTAAFIICLCEVLI